MKKYAKQICWQVKVCEKISATKGFPNEEIIQIFMNPEHDILGVEASAKIALAWKHPKLEALESFLEGIRDGRGDIGQLHCEATHPSAGRRGRRR